MNLNNKHWMKMVICFFVIKQFENYIYILRSLNHKMYLRLIQKSTLAQFDDKLYYENFINCKAWTWN